MASSEISDLFYLKLKGWRDSMGKWFIQLDLRMRKSLKMN